MRFGINRCCGENMLILLAVKQHAICSIFSVSKESVLLPVSPELIVLNVNFATQQQ